MKKMKGHSPIMKGIKNDSFSNNGIRKHPYLIIHN